MDHPGGRQAVWGRRDGVGRFEIFARFDELLQAGFTFIGLSDRSEWGVLLSLGRNYVIGPGGNPFAWWWIYIPPTLAIVLFGVGWNLLGDGLNDWLNPHK
jgi:peptide/nickel transport system permease protein